MAYRNKDKIKVVSAFRLGINSLINPKLYNGFFGLSASYPFFSNESLEDYCEKYYYHKCIDEFIEFGLANFNNFLVFLMDLPLSYNLIAFSSIKQDDARKIAKKVGDILEKRISQTTFQKNNSFRLLRWKNVENEPEFNKILNSIKSYSKKDKRFESECTNLTISGTWNKLKTIRNKFGTKRYKESLSIAKQYSFLDIAVSLYLYEKFPVEISKYECPSAIRALYNNLFPELQEELNLPRMGHIQLSFQDKVYLRPFDDQFVEQNEK